VSILFEILYFENAHTYKTILYYISANFSLFNRILPIIRAVRNGSLLIQLYVNLIEESKVVQLVTWGGEREYSLPGSYEQMARDEKS